MSREKRMKEFTCMRSPGADSVILGYTVEISSFPPVALRSARKPALVDPNPL